MVRNTEELNCGCRNITIKNCKLQKKRNIAIAISLNYDNYARSYYEGCEAIPQSNITLENILVENEVGTLLHSTYPTENVVLRNIDFKNSRLCFDKEKNANGLIYPEVNIIMENVVVKEENIDLY